MDTIWTILAVGLGVVWAILAAANWVAETAVKYLALPALAVFGVYIFFLLMRFFFTFVRIIDQASIDLRALRGSVEDIKTAIDDIKTTLDDVKDSLERTMFEHEMDDVPDAE